MNILQKIASYLFEEEEIETEVIADDVLEPVSLKEEVKKAEVKVENKEALIEEKPVVEMKEVKSANHLGSITVDEAKPQKEVRKPLEKIRNEYDFSPVISPMYGTGKANDKKPLDDRASKNRKHNPLGTVISPMYGTKELEQMEEKAHQTLEVKEVKQSEPMQDDDLVNIPLDQMLVKDDTVDRDDVLQFSLFGEDEIVKHAMHVENEGKKA